jgi:2,3-dihydroxybenzoate decarboxylase
VQVLSYPYFGGRVPGRPGPASTVQDINDRLARLVEKYPNRFAAFASLVLDNPEEAADELERAVSQLGCVGTMLWGDVEGRYLHDQENWVLFEKAVKLDVPIYIHMGGAIGGVMGQLVGGLLGGSACGKAMGLIFNGVFDEFPDLKIILGHMGEAIPFWMWRLDNQIGKTLADDQAPHPDWIKKGLKKTPSQYFKDNFYITTSGMFWLPPFQLIYSALGADRILFAADYPPESALEASQFIDSVPICDIDKEKICHLNSDKLFRLKS